MLESVGGVQHITVALHRNFISLNMQEQVLMFSAHLVQEGFVNSLCCFPFGVNDFYNKQYEEKPAASLVNGCCCITQW